MEEDLYERIGEADLNPNYKDGQVYQHTDINNMLSILKTAINENYYDIQRLENGTKNAGNATSLDGAALSRYLDEELQADDNKIPSSQQAKAYIDGLLADFNPPVRGVDYWTEEDQEYVIDEAADKIIDNIKGEYDSQTTYQKFNTVTYQGSTYYALDETIGNPPTDTQYWGLYAKRGDSAYELYVKNGGTLTEEEWLDEFTNAENFYNKSEIDNKLFKRIYGFDNVESMKNDTNLINGNYARTLGYYEKNDGGSALYKITNEANQNEYQETLNNGLYATLIIENNTINVKQIGLSNNELINNSNLLQNAINIYDNITFFFPYDNYTFTNSIDLDGKTDIKFLGQCSNRYNQNNNSHLLFKTSDGNGFINVLRLSFEKLSIDGYNKTGTGISGRFVIRKCHILRFNVGLDGKGYISESSIYQNNNGIIHSVDSRIINNQIYNNTNNGIRLTEGNNDNIITNNKIEWNGGIGISLYKTSNNVISNNIIDRNTEEGIRCALCTHSVINGNLLRRNFISDTQLSTNCQIRFDENNYVSLCNNVTRTGNTQDDNTGYMVPYVAIYITKNTNCIILGNDFSGGLKNDPVVFYLQDMKQLFYANDSTPLFDRIANEKKTVLVNNVTVQSQQNTTTTIPVKTLSRYDFNILYFEIFYRNAINNQYQSALIKVQLYKRTADTDHNMAVSIDNPTLGDLGISGSVSYNTDENQYYLTLTLTNNDTSDYIKVSCSQFNLI